MCIRLSRMSLVATVALFFTLVVIGNITDYGTNFAFVQHVLLMDTTFQRPSLMWRAIHEPVLHRVAYGGLIAWQFAAALICWLGTFRLWTARRASAAGFERAKATAVAGLTAGLLLYTLGFVTIGGEWFAMWQSEIWNGQAATHIFFTFVGLALLHLCGPERELPDGIAD